MPRINHVNFADKNGRVYCCLRNKVVQLDEDQRTQFCSGCAMYAGNAGGLGVVCSWEDPRPLANPHLVWDPDAERASNQAKQIRISPSAPPAP